MKKIMWLLMAVLVVTVGCEQKVENQGNFAKTDEFFKEIDSSKTQASNESQGQPEQAQPSAVTQVQPAVAPAPTTAEVAYPASPTINDIQQALQNANLYQGNIDGVSGPKTKKAILDFQAQNNLKVDGKVGPKTWQQLRIYLTQSVPTESGVQADAKQTASSD